MTVVDSTRPRLTVAGRPITSQLRDVSTLSRRMVGHFIEHVAPCGTLPGDALQGDVTAVTRVCLELALNLLDGHNLPEQIDQVGEAAAEWAREGVPIDTINHAIHEGFKLGLDALLSNASPADYADLVTTARRLLEILDTITTTVSMAYVREYRSVVSEHHTAVHTLTSALLGGHSTSTMARSAGSRSPPPTRFWRWRFRRTRMRPRPRSTARSSLAGSCGASRPNWPPAAVIGRCRC